jgi:hypothetical protein
MVKPFTLPTLALKKHINTLSKTAASYPKKNCLLNLVAME